MYDYNMKSSEQQRLKSKEQIQQGVKVGSSLLQYVFKIEHIYVGTGLNNSYIYFCIYKWLIP